MSLLYNESNSLFSDFPEMMRALGYARIISEVQFPTQAINFLLVYEEIIVNNIRNQHFFTLLCIFIVQ